MVNKSIFLSLLVIGVVAAAAGAGTWAQVGDSALSVGNTITTGEIDLIIQEADGTLHDVDCTEGDYALVTINDIKPGVFWTQERTKMIWIDPSSNPNPASVSLVYKDVNCYEPIDAPDTEPECESESHTGEDFDIDQVILVDTYFNGILIDTRPLSACPDVGASHTEVVASSIPLGVLTPGVHYPVQQVFYINDVPSHGGIEQNWIQGDVCEFSEMFVAEQLPGPVSPVPLP